MSKEIFVINLKGEKEPFSLKKVYQSARNVGASKELAREIAQQIQQEVYPDITTKQIFNRIYEMFLERSLVSAIKFNLKRAIEKLGPTGFPFEKFIGKIFNAEGFAVKLNQFIPGFCRIRYEIDFLAQKEKLVLIGECKYHQFPGERVDLQVALANAARFFDIKKGKFANSHNLYKSILVTNTKFTPQAIAYSQCMGIQLLGWKYPPQQGLEKLIERNKLYPITILPTVSSQLAKNLIDQGIVLVQDVLGKEFAKLSIAKKQRIIKEAEILLKE